MHREPLQFNRQPFQDPVDTSFFFSGGERRGIVDQIKHGLADAVPLIVLTGDDGSGKTMICRMVEKELPVDFVSVFLPRMVESYDEMVRIIAQETDVLHSDGMETETKDLLQHIVIKLKKRNQRIVVIFDEAEKIFLATLERIRKVLGQVNEGDICFQIILSGGKQLKDNLKQLGIVSFREVKERYFDLRQLTEEEIHSYLNYCLKRASGKEYEFFSQDIVRKIKAASAGNFLKINQLARECLETEAIDASFLSLLDTMDQDDNGRRRKATDRQSRTSAYEQLSTPPDYLKFSKIVPGWLLYGGGAIVVFLLCFILYGRFGNETAEVPMPEVPVIVLKDVEPLKVPSGDQKERIEPQNERKTGDVFLQRKDSDKKDQEKGQKRRSEKDAFKREVVNDGGANRTTDSPPSEESAETIGNLQETAGDRVEEGKERKITDPSRPAKPVEAIRSTEETVGDRVEEGKERKITDPSRPAEPVEAIRSTEETVGDRVEEGKEEKITDPARPAEPVEAIRSAEETVGDRVGTNGNDAKSLIVIKPSGKKVLSAAKPAPILVIQGIEKKNEPIARKNEPVILPDKSVAATDEKRIIQSSVEEIKQSQPPEPVRILTSEQKKGQLEAVSKETEIPVPVITVDRDERLFRERIAAGARWLVGENDDKFTVQLMVLKSENAEESLREMLKKEEYRSIIEHLYVLRRVGVVSTVMVFWGEYNSLSDARNARNTLPAFLRKHRPYAISVRGAVAKANAL